MVEPLYQTRAYATVLVEAGAKSPTRLSESQLRGRVGLEMAATHRADGEYDTFVSQVYRVDVPASRAPCLFLDF